MSSRVNGSKEPDRWSRTGFEPVRERVPQSGTLGDRLRVAASGIFDSLGSLRKSLTGWGFHAGSGSIAQLLSNIRGDKEITRPYWQHPWIFASTYRIASCASEARIRFWRDRTPEAEEIPDDDPIYRLFERPHPSLSYSRWLQLITTWHWLYGDQVWALRKGNGEDWIDDPNRLAGGKLKAMVEAKPNERLQLWPLKGDLVEEVVGDSRMVEAWRLNVEQSERGATQINIPVEATAHVYSPDPYDPMFRRGLGRLQAVLRTAQIDYAAEQYIEAGVANGGVPNILLVGKHGFTEAQAKAAQKKIREEHQDSSKNGMAMVVGGDIDVHFPGIAPKDMEWGALRYWDRETIIAVLGASPAFLGITEKVQRGNAEESIKSVYTGTIVPWLEILAAEIQNELLPLFPEPYRSMGVTFETSHVKALQESEDAKIERATKLFTSMPLTVAEAAEAAGWDIADKDIAGRDERHPLFIAPSDTTNPRPDDPQVGQDGEEGRGAVPVSFHKKLDLLAHEPFRIAAARQFRDDVQTFEAQMAKPIRRTFEGFIQACIRKASDLAKEGKPVTAGTKDHSPDDLDALFPDLPLWKEKLAEATRGVRNRLWLAQVRYIADSLGAQMVLNLSDPIAVEFLARKEIAIKETVETLRDAIRATLLRNLQAGPKVGTLADQIREVLESYRADLKVMQDSLGSRAELIARTETTSIANGARLEEARKQGIQEMRWISARDGNVHDSHSELDGKTAPIGQVFGYGLRFPGDPQASVSQIANCRCSVAATSNGL